MECYLKPISASGLLYTHLSATRSEEFTPLLMVWTARQNLGNDRQKDGPKSIRRFRLRFGKRKGQASSSEGIAESGICGRGRYKPIGSKVWFAASTLPDEESEGVHRDPLKFSGTAHFRRAPRLGRVHCLIAQPDSSARVRNGNDSRQISNAENYVEAANAILARGQNIGVVFSEQSDESP
jgi:hypothetical protein